MIVADVHIRTTAARTAPAATMVRNDLVPSHVEMSQSGNKKAMRSGLNPLPTPSARAPHVANRFSPFQQRQQQYAVSSENSARFGRRGPSKAENQKTGFTSRRNVAAVPAHDVNIRRVSRNTIGRHNALTRIEIATKVRSGSRNTTFTI